MKHSHRFNTMDAPPSRGNVYKVITVKPGQNGNMIVLAHKPFCMMCHYGNNRTSPCTKPFDACPGHINQWPLRWKGFLFVKTPSVSRPFFIAMTPQSHDDFKEALGKRESARGMIVNVFRTGAHKNSPLGITFVGEYQGDAALPDDVDPMPTLLRMWGLDKTS